jgi:hypothetical protein
MPTGPFGPLPQVPVEIPNHSAVTLTCFGTVMTMRIAKGSPGRTRKLGTWPSLRGAKDFPLMAGANVTLGAVAGQNPLAAAHPEGEEQPPAANPPATSAIAAPARRSGITRQV